MADSKSSSKPLILIIVGILVLGAVLFAVTRDAGPKAHENSPSADTKVTGKSEAKTETDPGPETPRHSPKAGESGASSPAVVKQFEQTEILAIMEDVSSVARAELKTLQANMPGAVNEEDRRAFRAKLDAVEDPEERKRMVLERQANWRTEAKKQTPEQRSRQQRLTALSHLGNYVAQVDDIDACGDFDKEMQAVYGKMNDLARKAEDLNDAQVKSAVDSIALNLRSLRREFFVLYPPPELESSAPTEPAPGSEESQPAPVPPPSGPGQ